MTADALLAQDIELVRQSVIAAGILCIQAPDPLWEDLLAVMNLPASVVVIVTRLEDGPPTPVSDPELTQKPSPSANPPMRTGDEQRTNGPFPASEPDALLLERTVRMARRRQLRIEHQGPEWISLHSDSGAVPYEGSVREVYAALKADSVSQLPLDPAAELRARLAFAGTRWDLQTDSPGAYTLRKNDVRMFSGSLEVVSSIAASKIFNTINWDS